MGLDGSQKTGAACEPLRRPAAALNQQKGGGMNYLKKRFAEGSTWAGLVGLIPALITAAQAGISEASVGSLLVALICVIYPEARSRG